MTNAHNTDALLLGTAEFSFAEGATTEATARAIGYRDFGNMVSYSFQPTNTKVEHKGSYRGTKRIDKTKVTDIKTIYQLKLDEFTYENCMYLFYGSAPLVAPALVQSAVTTFNPMTYDVARPFVPGTWYDVTTGTDPILRARALTSWVWAGKVAGVDYEVDMDLGRVRFLGTAPVVTFTPTGGAAAIVGGDALSSHIITPLTTTLRNGWGRMVVFDDKLPNQVVMEHDSFGCSVALTGNADGGGDAWSEYTLEVQVTNPVGLVYVRERSASV